MKIRYKLHIFMIVGDKKRTKFMQACDIFDNSKVLGHQERQILSFTSDGEIKSDHIDTIINLFKEFYEKDFIVSLVHLTKIEKDKTNIEINKGQYKPYINKAVRIISNGKNWSMFHDILKELGIEVGTNQYMYIKD